MKILVTGITGFIGKRLALRMAGQEDVFAICRGLTDSLPKSIQVVQADFDDPEALCGAIKALRPDVCIHLAWQGIPDYGFENSRWNLDKSSILFRCLVEECGCKKIIAIGSCWEYGKAFGVCREADPVPTPGSYFVWAKRSLWDLGMMLAAKHKISFIWTRLFYVYGPGQRGGSLMPTLAQALMKGEAPVIKTPHNANDFIYVDDVVDALLKAAGQDVPTGTYNIGTGKSTPVWRLCEEFEKALERQPVCAARLRALTVEPAADFWADVSHAGKELGWRARTDIAQGIGKYIKSLEE